MSSSLNGGASTELCRWHLYVKNGDGHGFTNGFTPVPFCLGCSTGCTKPCIPAARAPKHSWICWIMWRCMSDCKASAKTKDLKGHPNSFSIIKQVCISLWNTSSKRLLSVFISYYACPYFCFLCQNHLIGAKSRSQTALESTWFPPWGRLGLSGEPQLHIPVAGCNI